MDQFPGSASFSAANLAHLPLDLLQPILFSPILSRQDVKSVRLACRLLADKAASVLFYRIRISKTEKHSSVLLALLTSLAMSAYLQPQDSDWASLLQGLLPQMAGLFWLQSESLDFDKRATIAAFLPQFQAAVANMPNLHTLVSKPMHSERSLQGNKYGYPITARIVNQFIHQDLRTCIFKEGFTAFLIPILRHLATRPGPRVTRLHFADKTGTTGLYATSTALTHLTHKDAAAFSAIQHLDMCIGGDHLSEDDLRGLVSCLGEASHLSNLHICQERAWNREPENPTRLLSLIPTLPRLAEVHLDDMLKFKALHLADEEIPDLPSVSPFVDFMSRHASTLRKVYVTTTNITKEILVRLARLKSLHVDRLVLMPHEDVEEEDPWPTNVRVVLDFVNKGLQRDEPTPELSGSLSNTVRTHSGIFDLKDWTTAAIFDARHRGWSQRGYESWEVISLNKEAGGWRDEDGFTHEIGHGRVYNSLSGLWQDRKGTWNNPRTDEEIIELDRLNYDEGEDIWFRRPRLWNWELGLWTSKADNGKITYQEFAVNRAGMHDDVSQSDDDMIS
ncbi:hypothetical protein ACHAPJ_009017, partial [Fusarium lateritium]